jgi:hypothetical protein
MRKLVANRERRGLGPRLIQTDYRNAALTVAKSSGPQSGTSATAAAKSLWTPLSVNSAEPGPASTTGSKRRNCSQITPHSPAESNPIRRPSGNKTGNRDIDTPTAAQATPPQIAVRRRDSSDRAMSNSSWVSGTWITYGGRPAFTKPSAGAPLRTETSGSPRSRA